MRITFVVDSYNVPVHLRCPDRLFNRTLAAFMFHLPHKDCLFNDVLIVRKGGEVGPTRVCISHKGTMASREISKYVPEKAQVLISGYVFVCRFAR